jgi:hypothetical protein
MDVVTAKFMTVPRSSAVLTRMGTNGYAPKTKNAAAWANAATRLLSAA